MNCKRCGKAFEPVLLESINVMSTCCEACSVRNLFDALELPTPPAMLDRYTKIPTLSEQEFQKKLHEDSTDS